MRDMIERIMEMDKAAQEVTQKVQKEKLSLEQEIKNLKKKIRSEYLERARKRIENNRIEEQKAADDKIETIKNSEKNISQRIEKSYLDNKDMWINDIVKRVLGEWKNVFSSNVILAKALAMYGKRIKGLDYDELINCKSVSEVASYLKNNTAYSSVLSQIDEINIHRHELEALLKEKPINDLAILGKYELTTKEIFSDFIIIKAEIEMIIHALMSLIAQKDFSYFKKVPDFFKIHTKIDLLTLSNAKSYDDFFKAIEKTPYYKLLLPIKNNNDINLSKAEQALYNYLYTKLFEILTKIKNKKIRNNLKNLFVSYIDYSNFIRILRIKHSLSNASSFAILKNGSIKEKYLNDMMKANTEADTFEIMYNIVQGKKLLKIQYSYIDQIPMKALYYSCRHAIHSSSNSSIVFISYMFLSQIELSNIINIIEGIRYNVSKDEIRKLLILKA